MEKYTRPNTPSNTDMISMRPSHVTKKPSQLNYFTLILLLLAAIGLMPQLAHANAGMLVTAEDGGKTYLLLVKTHKHDYYEFPGGHAERGENLLDAGRLAETLYEAALRETMEETRGFLGRQQLGAASKETQVIEVGKYSLFLAKLPFFQLDDIRRIKIPRGKKWMPMQEVVNYAWVDVDEVIHQPVVKARNDRVIKLHPITPRVIEAGRLKHWF